MPFNPHLSLHPPLLPAFCKRGQQKTPKERLLFLWCFLENWNQNLQKNMLLRELSKAGPILLFLHRPGHPLDELPYLQSCHSMDALMMFFGKTPSMKNKYHSHKQSSMIVNLCPDFLWQFPESCLPSIEKYQLPFLKTSQFHTDNENVLFYTALQFL